MNLFVTVFTDMFAVVLAAVSSLCIVYLTVHWWQVRRSLVGYGRRRRSSRSQRGDSQRHDNDKKARP